MCLIVSGKYLSIASSLLHVIITGQCISTHCVLFLSASPSQACTSKDHSFFLSPDFHKLGPVPKVGYKSTTEVGITILFCC